MTGGGNGGGGGAGLVLLLLLSNRIGRSVRAKGCRWRRDAVIPLVPTTYSYEQASTDVRRLSVPITYGLWNIGKSGHPLRWQPFDCKAVRVAELCRSNLAAGRRLRRILPARFCLLLFKLRCCRTLGGVRSQSAMV